MKKEMKVADLHCDLLAYLAVNPRRSAKDAASRCSISQMREGQVKLQTLAIYVETHPESLKSGMDQLSVYKKLPYEYPGDFVPFQPHMDLTKDEGGAKPIVTLTAFENASGFCPDGEPLQKGLDRLNSILAEVKPLYISLTWNLENRFGGGALTKIGLRDDGKKLLEELDQKKVAVDLSHASDPLAYEIIDYMIGKGLDIPVLASHSNARCVANYPRNLPDDIAKEIFKRKGVIGLNLFKRLVGESKEHILKNIAHWIDLGGAHQICLGADFFCETDVSKSSLTYLMGGEPFFEKYGNASTYPRLLSFIEDELGINVEGLAFKNLWEYLQNR